MASKLDKDIIEESLTEFPQANQPWGTTPYQGKFSVLFKKLFSPPAKRGRPAKVTNTLQGDAPVTTNNYEGVGGFSTSKTAIVPKIEHDRRRKYQKFEKMDEYPEIGTALDIYADDATLIDDNGNIVTIETEHTILKDEFDKFVKDIKIERYIWDIVRNVVKYGDCFVENIVDLNNPDAGIQRLKVLNPNFLFRVEDKFGYLKHFLQEVPSNEYSLGYGTMAGQKEKKKVILDKEQIVHFRRATSDQNYYPYGKSVMAPAIRAWESLRLMEDAMVI